MMELLPYKKSRINFICCLEGMGTRQTSYYQKYQYHGKCLLCTSYYPASSSFNRAVYQKKKKTLKTKQPNPPKHTQNHSTTWLIKFKVQDYI